MNKDWMSKMKSKPATKKGITVNKPSMRRAGNRGK